MIPLFYSEHWRIVTEAKNNLFFSFKRYFRVILKYKLSVHCTTYMATFKNQIEEYELTKIQEDDHTYDHIKMENALNLTWKQWFHILYPDHYSVFSVNWPRIYGYSFYNLW